MDLARTLAFACHIPPRQILRRLALTIRRHAEQRLRPALRAAPASFARTAPLPLFAPRPTLAVRTQTGWRFTFLARTLDCPDPIDWQLGGPGAATQLWRMNLHYFHWAEALPDDQFIAAVDQWIVANPPFVPGAAEDGWNGYSLSLRVTVWLQQLAQRQRRLDPAWVAHVANAAARQLRFLETHLETDIGGNHLVKNIVALLWGASAIDSANAPRWRATGLKLLRSEIGQILTDGMHFERSASYHAQVLGDLLDIRHALGADPLDGKLDSAIVRAAQVVADLTHPDGGPALFGDSGLTMARASRDLREAARSITGQSFAPRASFDLAQGGYAGLRSGRDLLLVDAGPLGPDHLPGHAHGDIGAIEWSVAGERLIVDQGVFTYVEGAARDASRSAANHNTLAAPGADQGDFFGAFRLGKRARLLHRKVELGDDRLSVTLSLSGLVGPHGGARHSRQVEARPGGIVIDDQIDRALPGAAISFLLAPGVTVTQDAGGLTLSTTRATCRLTTDGQPRIEAATWWPDMGVELPTHRIRISLSGRSCHTTLSIMDRTSP